MPADQTPPVLDDQDLEQLPIFPLPGAVLFPGTLMPLHIFEPRYRQMVRDAIAHGRPIAIAAPLHDDDEIEPGTAPVRPIAGVGAIVHHEALPDGRYNILLLGLGRVQIDDEHDTDTLYRQVRAHRLDDDDDDPDEIEERMATVRQVVFGLHRNHPQLATSLAKAMMVTDVEPSALVDAMANALFTDPPARQALLEETSPRERLDRVIDRLVALLDQPGAGPGAVH